MQLRQTHMDYKHKETVLIQSNGQRVLLRVLLQVLVKTRRYIADKSPTLWRRCDLAPVQLYQTIALKYFQGGKTIIKSIRRFVMA